MKLNSVCIEDISNSHPIDTMQFVFLLLTKSFFINKILFKLNSRVCSLSNVPSICQYKIKINDSSPSQWYLISKLCRNRVNKTIQKYPRNFTLN